MKIGRIARAALAAGLLACSPLYARPAEGGEGALTQEILGSAKSGGVAGQSRTFGVFDSDKYGALGGLMLYGDDGLSYFAKLHADRKLHKYANLVYDMAKTRDTPLEFGLGLGTGVSKEKYHAHVHAIPVKFTPHGVMPAAEVEAMGYADLGRNFYLENRTIVDLPYRSRAGVFSELTAGKKIGKGLALQLQADTDKTLRGGLRYCFEK